MREVVTLMILGASLWAGSFNSAHAIPPPVDKLPEGFPETVEGYNTLDLWVGFRVSQWRYVNDALGRASKSPSFQRRYAGPLIWYGAGSRILSIEFVRNYRSRAPYRVRRLEAPTRPDVLAKNVFDPAALVTRLRDLGIEPDDLRAADDYVFPDLVSKTFLSGLTYSELDGDRCPAIEQALKSIERRSFRKLEISGIGRDRDGIGRFQNGSIQTVVLPSIDKTSDDPVLHIYRGDGLSEAKEIERELLDGLTDCEWTPVTPD